MSPGDRVLFIAPWSSFKGQRGKVTQTEPCLMVVFPDDPRPIRVGEREVIPDPESQQHATAGE